MRETLNKLIVIIAIVTIFVVIYVCSHKAGYNIGYEKGTFHTVLHLQATGYLPSMAWRETHKNDDIQTPEQLLDLSPEITFTSGDPCITLGRK